MMAYYYIMYGVLPQSMDFTCAAVHMKEIRLFMLFETARSSSLPAMWTDSEKELYDGHEDARRANFGLDNNEMQRRQDKLKVLRSKARPDYKLLNAQLIDEIDMKKSSTTNVELLTCLSRIFGMFIFRDETPIFTFAFIFT